jgi:3-oxoacyl-[acyl-carrier-protein] synthase-3
MKISKTAYYLPPKIENNDTLSKLVRRSPRWIHSRAGVLERRIAEESMHQIGARCVRKVLSEGQRPDCIINASVTPVQLIPDSSVFLQDALGFSGIPSWSIHATCLSFIVALHTAAAMIHAGSYRKILIVSSEAATAFRNMKEPESAVLIGDGAAAALIEPAEASESSAFIDWEMGTWPEGKAYTEFRGAGTYRPPYIEDRTRPEDYTFHMNGPRIFRMARQKTGIIMKRLLDRNGLTIDDIDWLVPHQASGPALKSAPSYGIPEQKLINMIEKTGNTIAASTPMALAWADQQNKLKRGDLILIGGSGAGLSIAYALIRW